MRRERLLHGRFRRLCAGGQQLENTTLRDYARFGQIILDGGAGIVPAGWIETTRSSSTPAGLRRAGNPEGAYHQFWIEDPRARRRPDLPRRLRPADLDQLPRRVVAVKLLLAPEFSSTSTATLKACHAISGALS